VATEALIDLPRAADVVVASQRATARIVGVLFIVATVTSIIGGSLLLPLEDPDYLTEVAAHEGQTILGVLLEFTLALSVIGIAALLLPVLRLYGEGMAVGYVAVRTVEATFILIASTTALLVLALSQDWGSAGGVGVEPVGSALLSAREWTNFVGTLIVFGVSAVILNTLLYRTRLVPVWLSLLGLVGGAPAPDERRCRDVRVRRRRSGCRAAARGCSDRPAGDDPGRPPDLEGVRWSGRGSG
jgi:hypothetical protein